MGACQKRLFGVPNTGIHLIYQQQAWRKPKLADFFRQFRLGRHQQSASVELLFKAQWVGLMATI
jgi:hypothetical protein